jgi:hypothetical protein
MRRACGNSMATAVATAMATAMATASHDLGRASVVARRRGGLRIRMRDCVIDPTRWTVECCVTVDVYWCGQCRRSCYRSLLTPQRLHQLRLVVNDRSRACSHWLVQTLVKPPSLYDPLNFLSHFVAVRTHLVETAYVCPHTDVPYCDLQNATYALLLDMLWPEACYSMELSNEETKGDVIEAFLGWCFFNREHCTATAFARAHDVCRDLETMAVYVYQNYDFLLGIPLRCTGKATTCMWRCNGHGHGHGHGHCHGHGQPRPGPDISCGSDTPVICF